MTDELVALYAQLYFDQDVPVQLAAMIRARGFDVVTTLEAGALGQSDDQQLARAVADGRVIVTHNRLDFEERHTRCLADGRSHCGIVITAQRRDLALTRNRLLELLNRFDREQLRDGLFYV